MLTRLALALLALAGFAAPAPERERDGLVQTSRAPRAAAREPQSLVALVALVEVVETHALAAALLSHVEPSSSPLTRSLERRYLLHRAWLL